MAIDACSQTDSFIPIVECYKSFEEADKARDTYNIERLKKIFKVEHIVHPSNDDGDELTELLEIAKTGNRENFIWGLSWFAWCTNGKPKPTMFVFPKTLTKQDRMNIHRMSKYNILQTYTSGNESARILHVFVGEMN